MSLKVLQALLAFCHEINTSQHPEQSRQETTYNVTLRGVPVTIVEVDKQQILHILSMCL
jgi:hypothetical protein